MWSYLIEEIRETGIAFEAGLTDEEVSSAESTFQIHFPPDLREFLQTGLPSGKGFPNWRDGNIEQLKEWIDSPRMGVLFDVKHNGFWLEEWGPTPPSFEEAQRIVDDVVFAAPRLIPIYIHRMMPSEPFLAGNPVFSVHQTDIIYYGIDLRDYLIHEFLVRKSVGVWPIPQNIRKIAFWDVERFQNCRWGPNGSCIFDNSRKQLP